jgi:hypothetical protein
MLEEKMAKLNHEFNLRISGFSMRTGQSYMNALFTVDRDLYDAITGTSADPFYDNANLEESLRWLQSIGVKANVWWTLRYISLSAFLLDR